MSAPVRATVIIPTHDGGSVLLHSVASAMAQTVEDLEIFIVGDGVPDATRDVMADLSNRDKRVRFFDNPKGPRHGELHRHAALAEARGRIVCYLADDALWLPQHVETMERILEDAEFGHTLAASIHPDQSFCSQVGDLGIQVLRDRMVGGVNFVPLSCAGHLLSAYRQLPHGWRTAPDSVPTELYMWQQFLDQASFRFRTAEEITLVRLPSAPRATWSPDERLAELETWSVRLAEPEFGDELVNQSAVYFRREAVRALVSQLQADRAGAEAEERLFRLQVEFGEATQRLRTDFRTVADTVQVQKRHIEQLEESLVELTAAAEAAATARRRTEHELAQMRATLTWRLRDYLLRIGAARLAVNWNRRLKRVVLRRPR